MVFGWLGKAGAKGDRALRAASGQPLNRGEITARFAEAYAAKGRGDLGEALSIFARLNESNPGDTHILTQLGLCQREMGEAAAAREHLSMAVHADPHNLAAYKGLASVSLDTREFDAALSTVETAVRLAPADFDLHLYGGSACRGLGRVEESVRYLGRAWEIQPESALVFYQIECLSQELELRRSRYDSRPGMEAARRRVVNRLKALHRRKGLDSLELTYLIAILAGSREDFPEAVRIAREATSHPAMRADLALQICQVLRVVGDIQLELEFTRDCLEHDPDNLGLKFALGSAWVSAGSEQWPVAWRLMTDTFALAKSHTHPATLPLWEGQKPGKRKLLVYQDQGSGDAILCFRFLRELVERKIRFDLWVHPTLADLAERVPGPERVIRGKAVPRNPDPDEYAYAISLFGLISALHLSLDEIRQPPVVRPAAEQASDLRQRVARLGGARIGLLYGGNPERRDDWLRTVPQDQVRRLGTLEGVSWVNLMFDDRPERAEMIERLRMFDPMGDVKSFCDTAAIIDELDAVVAVDASVAHLAGLLGKPSWVLLPTESDWRWQIGAEASPWWPTVRALRSQAPGEWRSVFDSLLPELERFVAQKQLAPVPA